MNFINNQKESLLAKKITLILIFIFLIWFIKYNPYTQRLYNIDLNSLYSLIFYAYYFVINQTLGIVHESGHGVCYILSCPQFITALNGTIFQLLFPLLIGVYYKFKGDNFLFWLGVFFLGISLQYTAWYISTANEGLYVPASKSFLGVDGYHDFNFILTSLHLLKYYKIISNITYVISYIILFVSIIGMFLESFLIVEES